MTIPQIIAAIIAGILVLVVGGACTLALILSFADSIRIWAKRRNNVRTRRG